MRNKKNLTAKASKEMIENKYYKSKKRKTDPFLLLINSKIYIAFVPFVVKKNIINLKTETENFVSQKIKMKSEGLHLSNKKTLISK